MSLLVEEIAEVAHEVNKTYCESIGDNSQPSWKDAPQWQKDSAVQGVLFTWRNPDSTPEDSHKSWLSVKTADGWKYGPVKNADKKNPCYVPYDQLPKEQQVKDHLYQTVVKTLLNITHKED